MKTKDDNETFWLVVVDCLATFHNWPIERATEGVSKFEKKLLSKVSASEFGLIFHEEPFQVACEIAGKPTDIASHRTRYEAILKSRKW